MATVQGRSPGRGRHGQGRGRGRAGGNQYNTPPQPPNGGRPSPQTSPQTAGGPLRRRPLLAASDPILVRQIGEYWSHLQEYPLFDTTMAPENVQQMFRSCLKHLEEQMIPALVKANYTGDRQPVWGDQNPTGMSHWWDKVPGVPYKRELSRHTDPFYHQLDHYIQLRNILAHREGYGVYLSRARKIVMFLKEFYERFYVVTPLSRKILNDIQVAERSPTVQGRLSMALAEEEANRQALILSDVRPRHLVSRDDLVDVVVQKLHDIKAPGLLLTSSIPVGKTGLLASYRSSSLAHVVMAYHFCVRQEPHSQKTSTFVRSLVSQLSSFFKPYKSHLNANQGHLQKYLADSELERDGGWSSLKLLVWQPLLEICRAESQALEARNARTGEQSHFRATFTGRPVVILVDGLNHATDNLGQQEQIRQLAAPTIVDLVGRSADFLADHPEDLGWFKLLCTARGQVFDAAGAPGRSQIEVLNLESDPHLKDMTVCHVRKFVEARVQSSTQLRQHLANVLGSNGHNAVVQLRKSLLDKVVAIAEGDFLRAVELLSDLEKGTVRFDALDKIPSHREDQLLLRLQSSLRDIFPCYRPILEVLMASYHAATADDLLSMVQLDPTAGQHFRGPAADSKLRHALAQLSHCGLIKQFRAAPPEPAEGAIPTATSLPGPFSMQTGWRLCQGVKESLVGASKRLVCGAWAAYRCDTVKGHSLLAANDLCFLTCPSEGDFDQSEMRRLLQDILGVNPPSQLGAPQNSEYQAHGLLIKIEYMLKHLQACANGVEAEIPRLARLVKATGRDFTADVTLWGKPLTARPPTFKRARTSPLFWLAGRAWQKPGDGDALDMLSQSLELEQLRAPHPERFYTPLTLAASEGRLSVLNLLLSRGVSVSERDRQGWTVLHAAVSPRAKSRASTVEHLVKRCAVAEANLWSLRSPANQGEQTALHMAVTCIETLEAEQVPLDVGIVQLLAQGQDRHGTPTVDVQDGQGRTALMLAVQHLNVDAVRGLLQEDPQLGRPRADPLVRDHQGRSVLHHASDVQLNKKEKEVAQACVEVLLRLAPELLAPEHLNALDNSNETPLVAACRNGSVGVMTALLSCEGVLVSPEGTMMCPLAAAASHGKVEVIMRLKDRVGLAEANAALSCAAQAGQWQAVSELLRWEGIDSSHANSDGKSPLLLMASAVSLAKAPGGARLRNNNLRRSVNKKQLKEDDKKYTTALRSLLSATADEDLWAPAELAATLGNTRFFLAVFEHLRDKHESGPADLDEEASATGAPASFGTLLHPKATNTGSLGETLLMVAAQCGHEGVVQVICSMLGNEYLPTLDATNEAGRTALHLAAGHGHPGAVGKLLSAGADPTICSAEGSSPLVEAIRQDRATVVEELCSDPRVGENQWFIEIQMMAINSVDAAMNGNGLLQLTVQLALPNMLALLFKTEPNMPKDKMQIAKAGKAVEKRINACDDDLLMIKLSKVADILDRALRRRTTSGKRLLRRAAAA